MAPVRRYDVSEDLQIERRCAEPKESNVSGVGLEPRMVSRYFTQTLQDGPHLSGGCVAAQPHAGMEPEFVARGKVLQRQIRELSVGDADHASVESPNSGRPQANILDRTACITDL
jgi:hypothetical protein